MTKINLADYRPSGVRVLSGRGFGESIRRELVLNEVDKELSVVEVIIPSDILTVNPSFWLGLFGDSVRSLGRDGFLRKYQFNASNRILAKRDNAIRLALSRGNALIDNPE